MNTDSVHQKNVLIIGASGMLGNAMFRRLSLKAGLRVSGTVRTSSQLSFFKQEERERIVLGVDVSQTDELLTLFRTIAPQVVINCVGIVKQLAIADDPLVVLPLNALFPHRVARLCDLVGARLIHISTDCVFAGAQGRYVEGDMPDARDLYGLSKYFGEVHVSPHITLRTSIIGHELNSNRSLIDWFLSQSGEVRGFREAFFSGLPTVELARVVSDFVIPDSDLSGLFHVSADRISKYDLLNLVKQVYGSRIHIAPDDGVAIDRSLDSSKFWSRTGYKAPAWTELVSKMYASRPR